MAITTQGYDGVEHEIDEVGWADISGAYGSNYSVRGYSGGQDEKAGEVSVVSSADRTVSVAPGVFYGHGVRDVSDSTINVQCPTVAPGTSKWFTIAVRRDWQANVTTVEAIPEGQDGRVLASSRNTNPGVSDDQPLALVQITHPNTIPTQVIDLRCWSGNAGLLAAHTDALAYLDKLGSRVTVDGVQWTRLLDSAGDPVWERPLIKATGEANYNTDSGGLLAITHGLGRVPTDVSLNVVRHTSAGAFDQPARLANLVIWAKSNTQIAVRVSRVDTGDWFGGQSIRIMWSAE